MSAKVLREIYTEIRDPATGRYHEGWGVIAKGHASDLAAFESDVRDFLRDPVIDRVLVEFQHLHYTPRVKWCSRHDGFGCDNEGDWHGHWFAVRHNPASDCCHTLALPVRDRPEVTP